MPDSKAWQEFLTDAPKKVEIPVPAAPVSVPAFPECLKRRKSLPRPKRFFRILLRHYLHRLLPAKAVRFAKEGIMWFSEREIRKPI